MRNWPQTLRPASYKGAPFFVEDEALGRSGRFVAVHSFVKAEFHATEDMGRAPREFRIGAYLASDSADSDVRDFVELCSEPGPGTLVLPMLGPVEVRCTGCHVKARSDRLGFVGLDLDFAEAGTGEDAFPAAPIGDRLAAAALGEMPDAGAAMLDGLDATARQDALTLRLDPESAAAAEWAAPPSADYQGSQADAAARDDAFRRLFEVVP